MAEGIRTDRGTFFIRPYQEEDEEGVLNLWAAAFGKTMSRDLFRWKWLDNPYGHQIMLCVEEKGTPVAMYSGIPLRANWQGETVRFTHLMDHNSHPAYRNVLGGRTGIFVHTANAFFERFGGPQASIFMYGFPGKRHFFLGEKILHYIPLRGGMVFLSARLSDKMFRTRSFRGKIERIDSALSAFDDFSHECRRAFPFSVLRDAAFLEWRFFKHPDRKYEIWGYRSLLGRRLKAYAVLYRDGETMCIVDLVSLDDGVGLLDFMARLISVVSEKEIAELKTWLPPNHFLTKGLTCGGFKIGPEPIGFIPGGRTFHDKLDMDQVSDQIFYTMADGDLI